MIKGKQIQPKAFVDKPVMNYRKLDALNQSMLKTFDTDPIRFYNEFKLGKPAKEKKGTALIIGDLVDFYVLGCKGDEVEFASRFDEKFALFSGVKGTGQVFELADALFEETKLCANERGEITCSFETRFNAALSRVRADGKYKKKDDAYILDDFEKNGLVYFQMLMDNIGKTVVDVSLMDKAKIVGNNLLRDDFTRHLFKHTEYDYFTHFPIEWRYELGEDKSILCKSEVDMLIIDHDAKIIQPMDLKTTYDNESFDFMYIKNSYYLQNAFYHKAVKVWAEENGMGDFLVMPMHFIVGDTSSNNRRPLLYETSSQDVVNGMFGFDLRGTHYRGVHELIMDIAWAEENEVWDCSKEAFDNKGKMKLNINYD
jgi:hypothetical protein